MPQRLAAGIVLTSLLAGAAARAEEAPPADADFLEFLGTLDSDDEAWNEFLSTADEPAAEPAMDDAAAQPAGKVKRDDDK